MKENTMTHQEHCFCRLSSQLRRISSPMLIPTTAPDKCAMKLGCGPEEGSGGEKRSQTARPTSELTVANRAETVGMEESALTRMSSFKVQTFQTLGTLKNHQRCNSTPLADLACRDLFQSHPLNLYLEVYLLPQGPTDSSVTDMLEDEEEALIVSKLMHQIWVWTSSFLAVAPHLCDTSDMIH